MNWTNFLVIAIGAPAGMLAIMGLVHVNDEIQAKHPNYPAMLFSLVTIVLVVATIAGLS